MESNKSLDVKGLNCPLPILKMKKALKALEVGQVLEVITTDPGSAADFAAFCRTTGHELLGDNSTDGIYTFYIKNV
ncbi:MAG: tRNA 2-thiouridine synthesizing protein A [Enterobacterales bacterium]|jgi:tRNA 2-thiouridine synthesizing protein A